jgi:enoyl-CoA hydratase/carnithine racemase
MHRAVGASQDPAIERSAVRVTRPREGVALVTIAAEPLGVLRVAVKRALRAVLTELEADRAVRAVVLTGTGKAFSVGSDIKEFAHDSGWLLRAEFEENGLNDQIEAARFPVIAALNGHALGGGCVLALACDLRLAAASAKLGVPEVRVGAFASGSGTQRLARLVGRGRALYLLLTGRTISAAEALSLGLVEQVVDDGVLQERALDIASDIAAQAPAAVEASKRCVNEGLRHGWAHGMELEARLVVSVGLTDDAAEGQRAFLEKRPPRFTGR